MLKTGSAGAAALILAACGGTGPAPANSTSGSSAPTSGAASGSAPTSGATTAPAASPASTGSGPTTIIFHARAGLEGEFYARQAEAFHKAQNKVRVKLELTPNQEYDQKLTTLLAGGQLGDVLWSGIFFVFYPFSARGALMDLRPLAEASKIDMSAFFPAVVEQLTWEGKLTGWPHATHPGWTSMFVNQDAWKAASAPEPQWEWTYEKEWLSALQTVAQSSGAQGKYAFLFDYNPQAAYTFIRSWGGDWIDPNDRTKSLVNTPQTKAALMFMRDLVYQHKVSPPPKAVVEQMFANNLAASWAHGLWANGTLESTIKDTFKWQAFPMPAGPSGRGSFLGADSLCINSESKNPEASFEWVKWLTSKEAQLVQVAEGLPAPTRLDAWDDPTYKDDPNMQPARQWMSTANPWTTPANARAVEFRNTFNQNLQALFLEESDPEAVIEQIHTAVQGVLDKPVA